MKIIKKHFINDGGNMVRFLTFSFLLLLSFSQMMAQTQRFTRSAQIPTWNFERGGFGGVIAGVDFDKDRRPEIYVCNTNMVDRPLELIPRLYKFELSGTTWQRVWSVESDIPAQNTWPALTWGDMDNDTKPEIFWGPVNYLNAVTNPNPARILVYEYPGDGTDNMGVNDGFGGFLPNAKFAMTTTNMFELRPIKWFVQNVDADTRPELIFADRRGGADSIRYNFGIVQASNIPDNGNASEVWTVKEHGLNKPGMAGSGSKWDLAILNNIIYFFDNGGRLFPVRHNVNVWQYLPSQGGLAGGRGSFKGSVVADIDKDATQEIVVGSWLDPAVYVLRRSGDTLRSFMIADLRSLGARRLNGAASGDLDNDGNIDFVFGTRFVTDSVRNNLVVRVEYQGGDITSPSSYISSVIDSLLLPLGGDLDVITIANVDGDPAGEVIYTQGYSRGNPTDSVSALVVLDLQFTPVSVEREDSQIPSTIYLEQNYPNPFNPSTNIKFGLDQEARVDLRVFDILGREVAVLINNQNFSAGNYTSEFNAENLASGIYIYSLKADNKTITKKMHLLK
ncbi:MAG: hypothetical protein C0425_02910 [Chlorobiaceae bacterium]|nr:hypothetical protein [Chlorobiaceae bacterium]MBA4309271.1 hypothetical protein [Chlorobiaceae bacterium]